MSGCNHDKCLRDNCKTCCYCGKELKFTSNIFRRKWALTVRGDYEKPETWFWQISGPKPDAYHDDTGVIEDWNGDLEKSFDLAIKNQFDAEAKLVKAAKALIYARDELALMSDGEGDDAAVYMEMSKFAMEKINKTLKELGVTE